MKYYDAASQRFGWSKRSPQPGSMRDGDWQVGSSFGTAVYCLPDPRRSRRGAQAVEGERKARLQIAAHDPAPAPTVIAQMAAEQLGIPFICLRCDHEHQRE
jgi:xanthine dehydrogenase YagR molybdenum-binding subunit